MQIEQHKVVTLNYTLKDDEGNVIDQSQDGSFAYLHGMNNIVPGLENALTGMTAGETRAVSVPPEEGYGSRDDSRVQEVPRDMFPADARIETGMQFQAESPDGQSLVVTVVGSDADAVTVDGNHPLSGMPLHFDVQVVDIRDATQEEIDHGHVHGPGGHHHD